ncbi:MAG: DsbA family protein, partial [Acidobacteriia bacterium]|nr:DsbA family protein [Terriglobia bacterium]
APVTLIEFTDFECPYCSMFHAETFPRIKATFIDSGRLRFGQRQMPLPSHKNASVAAHAAICAGEQGRYWDLSEMMFSRSRCLSCQGVLELSKAVDLDRKAFEACMSSGKHLGQIQSDIQTAKELKIEGTPSFVLGKSTSTGVNGIVVNGFLPYDQFEKRIQAVLSAGGS